MSSVGGRPFVMVMREDFFMELFFFDDGCLGKAPGSKMEVVVVEVVAWLVWVNFGVLLEVFMLVQLMVLGWVLEMVVSVTREVL